jgi:chromosome segregation ATPase
MQMKAAEQQKQQLEEQLANAKAQLQEQGSVPEAAKQRIEELTLELQETKTLLDQQQRYQKEYPLLQQELITLRAQLDTLSQERNKRKGVRRKIGKSKWHTIKRKKVRCSSVNQPRLEGGLAKSRGTETRPGRKISGDSHPKSELRAAISRRSS